MENLRAHYYKLLRETGADFQRYNFSQINWKARMIGLTGARGVGKTTLVLQHIKIELPAEETLYAMADDFYFASHTLLDLADEFEKRGGKTLFIDEIHKYKEWSRELKMIYDYHPKLKVVFTGSSILDIHKGAADLSRRAVMYQMQGLSFREFLAMFKGIKLQTFSLQEIIEHKVETPEIEHPLPLFEEYLNRGYYPFAQEEDFAVRLQQIVSQTLEVDIPQYADMNVATGRKLKHLMAIIARSVPFKPNFTQIASVLETNRNNIADYFLCIEEAGLIGQLRDAAGGIKGFGKVEKVFLDNTNLQYNLISGLPNIGNVRETFFFNQLKAKYDIFSSPVSDFQVDGMTFEIGGKSKTRKQIKDLETGFVVKDNIEFGYSNIIPLWHFGMLY
ncbi:MAG: AAA family ATPase [Bacteroidales bacterium]|jgi:predicted AAA+ superfamily ATPase|nr:AAA family ATPase [Bacteroidales bacterium]